MRRRRRGWLHPTLRSQGRRKGQVNHSFDHWIVITYSDKRDGKKVKQDEREHEVAVIVERGWWGTREECPRITFIR